jgi:heme-degrading monooxygenase HmoA
MIARIWHGMVPVAKSEHYLHLMRTVAIPGYKSIPGNLDAVCLRRIDGDGDIVHFEMLTFWENVEAIKRFAGEDYDAAKYYDFDDEYLLEKEPRVRHFEVHRS